MEIATFAAGCFWGVEDLFRQIEGVTEAISGYTGGTLVDPTYQDVCSGTTGHAEAVQINFDPAVIPYESLLQVFWEIHDPTTLNRQGPDVGSQYRSAIFYHSEEQREAATASLLARQQCLDRPIVTEIAPATPFVPAEEYHQQYLMKHGLSSCHIRQ
jgi:peptide-methionine (S)-S-oxide reductase